ncbi:cobaltochelatase subunit CobN [Burkholderia vietnamiensis]|uniref:cobaltochelatase subunit CobN n=1 Tax=Burkholderia vietnamiensis TaxID=60552 RepID=UPI001CB371CB|nr:cobaltochelatase subunit CobN [Burkholderia vietnamiensis]CAG9220574.1 hypothetical protein BVI1335_3560002 [Burkholderia vietnamiensis]
MTQSADSLSRFPVATYEDVRARLLARDELALIDVREEDPYAQGHPLWAANLPLSKLELDAWTRIPRRDTPIVVFGEAGGEDLAPRAAAKLAQLGYTDVRVLDGGLAGWRAAGGELFIDVNVPSKAFGEWVEAERHTPSLSAEEVQALIDAQADVVIVDARRYDEYQTMNIPTSTSVPGAELVLRVRALAPNPATQVVVNCAGRTRSIIGTQSLINAGLPNPVAALRNGTIGWTLAGQTLEHGAARRFPDDVEPAQRDAARRAARAVAERAGVPRITLTELAALDEPEALNPVRARIERERASWIARGVAPDEARRRAGWRVFGARPGSYGAGLQDLIDRRGWQSDADLADAYRRWGGHAYAQNSAGDAASDVFGERLATIDAVVQNQDSREHDILDSNDYYQFQGGMTAAVRHLSGQQPSVYHGDHANPAAPTMRTLREEIARVIRSRVVNPKWLDGVKRHGYKGAAEMAATVDYLYGYDATARVLSDHQYALVADAYLFDDDTRAFLQRHNPHALHGICERFVEAMQRGLWQQPGDYRERIEAVWLDSEQLQEGRQP